MAISQELFSAILAMDAYNRGYNAGVELGAEEGGTSADPGVSIGTATILVDKGDAVAKSHGFYAVAYDDPTYGKIISYRGTTFEQGLNTLNDIIHGWTLGVGYSAASQPQLAKDFYLAVTGRSDLAEPIRIGVTCSTTPVTLTSSASVGGAEIQAANRMPDANARHSIQILRSTSLGMTRPRFARSAVSGSAVKPCHETTGSILAEWLLTVI